MVKRTHRNVYVKWRTQFGIFQGEMTSKQFDELAEDRTVLEIVHWEPIVRDVKPSSHVAISDHQYLKDALFGDFQAW